MIVSNAFSRAAGSAGSVSHGFEIFGTVPCTSAEPSLRIPDSRAPALLSVLRNSAATVE